MMSYEVVLCCVSRLQPDCSMYVHSDKKLWAVLDYAFKLVTLASLFSNNPGTACQLQVKPISGL